MSELRAELRPKNSPVFWRAYMLSWAVLAGGALLYLTVHTAPSGTMISTLAKAPDSIQETNRAELDREQLSAQVRSLNKTVASLRTDLAQFKQNASDRSQPSANTLPVTVPEQTVSALPGQTVQQEVSNITTASLPRAESKILAPTAETTAAPGTTASKLVTIVNATPSTAAQPTATLSPATAVSPATAPVAETQPRRGRNLATSLLRPGSVPPLPPYNLQATAAVATPLSSSSANNATAAVSQTARDAIAKSVPVATQTRAAAFGAPIVKPRQATGSAALSLSTAQSVTGLRASWLLLTTRHPSIFVGYQPRYVADQSSGSYRLLAGPISNHSDADRICTELRAQNVSCGVTSYIGSAL
jgi:hypothetical protein